MLTFENIKPIRNRLRKFDLEALIRGLAGRLHAAYRDPEKLNPVWLPWHLMQLIKWALLDDFHPGQGRVPDLNDLRDLRNRVWK